jgi:hypothetical protein
LVGPRELSEKLGRGIARAREIASNRLSIDSRECIMRYGERHDNLAEIRRRIGKRSGHRTKGYYRMARLNIRVIIIFCGLTKSSRARGARFTVINNAHNLLTDGKSRVTSSSR